MTRAVPVIVERSPGGGRGWCIRVDGKGRFLFCTAVEALEVAVRKLGLLGADLTERVRVARLLSAELGRMRRAEITAEVTA